MKEAERVHLRAEVARRIMGWRSQRIAWAYSGAADVWHDADGVGLVPEPAWRPDEAEAQCAAVLERMTALGFDYRIEGNAERVTVSFTRAGCVAGTAEKAGRREALLAAALAAVSEGEP